MTSEHLALVRFYEHVTTLTRDIVDIGFSDPDEVEGKLADIKHAVNELHDALDEYRLEQADDRQMWIPPTDMTWVR